MALTGTQYQSMRLKFRGLISNPYWFVSEAELDSFLGQLAIDATGSITTAQRTQSDAALAINLISPAYTPSAADVATFFAQALLAKPVILQALVPARYQQLKDQFTGVLSVAGVRTGAQMLGYFAAYAGNPLSIITSASVKLWLDSQLGTSANTWLDQSASGFNMTEATNPPSLTTIGTVPCYAGNGTNQIFTASGMTLTFGNWYWFIARQITWVGNSSFCGGTAGGAASWIQDGAGASPAVSIFNGGVVDQNPTAMTVGSWFRCMFQCTNSAADYLQVGAPGNKVTGTSGGLTGTGWNLFARAAANFGNVAIANVVVATAEPTAGEKTALDNWFAAKSFGGVVGF